MVFLIKLATNAMEKGVRVIIYSGNDHSLITHTGLEGVSSPALHLSLHH